MSQKSLLVFVVALILASSGCIELDFGDDNQEIVDDNKQEPVGETNMTSLEKRVTDLEATIADYEQPRVSFMEFNANDSYSSGLTNYYVSNLENLLCFSYNEQKSCYLYAMTYDINGIITSYSWEGSESDIEMSCFTIANSDPVECYAYATHTISLDVCQLESVDQTLMLRVYDNDGNSASASYDLDYDSACTVEEPDNTCASDSDCPPGTICQGGVCMEDTSECEDGEEMIENGTMRTCVDGQWGTGEPVPDGTVCDDGNPDTENDAYYNGVCVGRPVNHPPEIASIYFDPYQVTNETETVCLIYEISDPDDDQLSIFVIWLINNEPIDELEPDQCFGLAGYTIEVGDHLAVDVTVHDNEYTVTETWFTEIEEEPE